MKELEGARTAELSRKTNETDVYVSLNLDGNGTYE
jgi:imidazoleglycerol phosphate dehydratase HisB